MKLKSPKRFLTGLGLVLVLGCTSQSASSTVTTPLEYPDQTMADITKINAVATTADADPGSSKAANGVPFEFGKDAAGVALGKLLTPSAVERLPTPGMMGQRVIEPAGKISRPAPELPITTLSPPLLPIGKQKDISPVRLTELLPDTLTAGNLATPTRDPFPIGISPAIARDGFDQLQPAQVIAVPVPDRSGIGDRTVEFSATSATREVLPLRSTPAPFAAVDLPDPFVNGETIRLKTRPDVDANTAIGALQARPRP